MNSVPEPGRELVDLLGHERGLSSSEIIVEDPVEAGLVAEALRPALLVLRGLVVEADRDEVLAVLREIVDVVGRGVTALTRRFEVLVGVEVRPLRWARYS